MNELGREHDARKNNHALHVRAIVFGVNDSLISTVGLLAGISVAGVSVRTIVLTGIVYAVVEGFSMAVGNFLSEESAQEYLTKSRANSEAAFFVAVSMFFSFVFASIIPLIPYVLFERGTALGASVIGSVLTLFVVGAISAKIAHLPLLWRGTRMAFLGGAAIALGILIGLILPAA